MLLIIYQKPQPLPFRQTLLLKFRLNLLKSYSILFVQLSTQSQKRTLESTKVHIK